MCDTARPRDRTVMYPPAPRQWVLEYAAKPLTTNAERRGNRWERAESTREWREAFGWLAKQQAIPTLSAVAVTAQPFQQRGRLQDTAACNPAVKAAIDGIVDAGVIADDSGDYVHSILFLPARRGPDALRLTLLEIAGPNDEPRR